MSIPDALKMHLADYKRFCLGISEPGVFRYRGRDMRMHHILPPAYISTNLLDKAEPAASAFLAALSLLRIPSVKQNRPGAQSAAVFFRPSESRRKGFESDVSDARVECGEDRREGCDSEER